MQSSRKPPPLSLGSLTISHACQEQTGRHQQRKSTGRARLTSSAVSGRALMPSSSAGPLRFLPISCSDACASGAKILQKAWDRCLWRKSSRGRAECHSALSRIRFWVAVQARWRRRQARPTGQNRVQLKLAPFRMMRRPLEFADPREERLNEGLNTAIPIGVLGPVVRDEDHVIRNGRNRPPGAAHSGRRRRRIVPRTSCQRRAHGFGSAAARGRNGELPCRRRPFA